MSRTFRKVDPKWNFLRNRKGDGKAWQKPPAKFKRAMKAQRRAQEKQALRTNKEPPRFKKADTWDYL